MLFKVHQVVKSQDEIIEQVGVIINDGIIRYVSPITNEKSSAYKDGGRSSIQTADPSIPLIVVAESVDEIMAKVNGKTNWK